MPKASFLNLIVAGNLANDFIINIDGKAHNQVPGGSLLYAAAGARMRIDEIGLIGRINPDFPSRWLTEIETRGFDGRGITKSTLPFESRRFFSWRDAEQFDSENPVAQYARFGLTFPRELLGYHVDDIADDQTVWGNISANFKKTLPREFLNITAAHLCPLDFSTHVKLINLLETGSINTLTISPSKKYMTPNYLEKMPVILKGTSAFFPTEDQLTNLCQFRSKDVWEMMDIIAGMGCQLVVVSQGVKGYKMFDSATKKRYTLPAYPTRWLDPTGAEDAFCGAFIGEYKKSYDPIRSLLYGCVTASFSVEGTGPYYCLEALPGLAELRFEKMQPLICLV